MGHPRYSSEEIVARAKALYEQKIRAGVEPENIGKFLVIDIEPGDYEMDADEMAVIQRSRKRHPNGVFHMMRVGYPAMGTIGANLTRAGV
ncbi:MAG TPA: hypothetical protein VFB21_00575 [Chthonomonadaceae bacterium]|nr:hypothetical protein [Chthonomonadaceae bacterium]